MESFYKVWPRNKLKGLVFSVIKVEGDYWKVFLCFPSTVKTENLEEKFWRSFFSNFALPVVGNYDPNSLQISCRK